MLGRIDRRDDAQWLPARIDGIPQVAIDWHFDSCAGGIGQDADPRPIRIRRVNLDHDGQLARGEPDAALGEAVDVGGDDVGNPPETVVKALQDDTRIASEKAR